MKKIGETLKEFYELDDISISLIEQAMLVDIKDSYLLSDAGKSVVESLLVGKHWNSNIHVIEAIVFVREKTILKVEYEVFKVY
ncbi:MAG: hypothetical protein EOM67_16805 [Spirochaetia bacterium]|nr:hypothetical protein [Spirochaetia bacterium]